MMERRKVGKASLELHKGLGTGRVEKELPTLCPKRALGIQGKGRCCSGPSFRRTCGCSQRPNCRHGSQDCAPCQPAMDLEGPEGFRYGILLDKGHFQAAWIPCNKCT